MIEDASRAVTEAMTRDLRGVVHGRYKPMRGQAYVHVEPHKSSLIVTLPGDPLDEKTHRGTVLALGPPARLTDHPDSPEVPWLCEIGDRIVYERFVWMDRMRVLEFDGVKGHVCVVAQGEIAGVEE